MNLLKSLFFITVSLLLFSSCQKNSVDPENGIYGIFTVETGSESASVNGTINSETLDNLKLMLTDNPNIKTLNLGDMPGSEDDETNVLVGREIFNNEINTHLTDGSEIASGAVDLFLAGKKRTHETDSFKIGVHSWANGSKEATDFPQDSPEHDLFIDYYKAVGYSDEWAREFYFFTINAAPAADIHWMTEVEIERFGMFN